MCVALLAGLAAGAHADDTRLHDTRARLEAARLEAAGQLMARLRPESVRHAARIRAAYAPLVERLALRDRAALRAAVDQRRILRLPANLPWANVRLRLTGKHPIGELDIRHQPLYLAARPATVGCLLDVASRISSGAIEITSLVRHQAYQQRLARNNANARTSVPTHAMGLAFDISILHASRSLAEEIGNVLTGMAVAGDLFFVAETRQLVFHVVPAPERRQHFATLSEALLLPRPAGLPELPWPAVPALPPAVLSGTAAKADTGAPALASARYSALFAWLLTSGLGTPPGEDLLLAGAGALVAEGLLAWWPVVLLGILAVVLSDALLFWGGRAATASVSLTKRSALLPARLVSGLDAVVVRWGGSAVAIARFVPGIRAVVFVSAGARGLCPTRFLLIDACAAIVWVPLVLTVGAWGAAAALGDYSVLALRAWM